MVIDYIKTVLDLCTRFYRRRFSAAIPQNKDILTRMEKLLTDYFASDLPHRHGVPTVQYCADKLCLSTNYLSDLIREATGMSALKTIHNKMLDIAKKRLADPTKRINEISAELGFQQPQSFSNWFKKTTRLTPYSSAKTSLTDMQPIQLSIYNRNPVIRLFHAKLLIV